MIVDTHVHVLDPARFPYPQATRGYRPRPEETGTLPDLLALLDAHDVAGAVAVAASVYGSDNSSLHALHAAAPGRLRLVLACDPDSPDTLAAEAARPGVVGIRLNLTDDRRLDDPARLGALLDVAQEAGLVVCLQAAPATAAGLLAGRDRLRVVLDHLGRPDLAGGAAALRDLARRPRTWLKLSGGFRLAPGLWPEPAPEHRALVATWPAERLIWGSDWPFINLARPRPAYGDCLSWAAALIGARAEVDPGANARALFGWRP